MGADLDVGRLRVRLDRAISDVIEPATVARRAPLTTAVWAIEGEPLPFSAVANAEFTPIAPGTPWGPPWSTAWFRVTGRVPREWDDAPVEVDIDLGFEQGWAGFQAEGLVCDPDGVILKGIEPLNTHVRLPSASGREVHLLVEAAANPDILRHETFSPTPLGHPRTAGSTPLYVFTRADLVQRDPVVQDLLDDVRVLRGLIDVLPEDRPRSARVRRALSDMLAALDPRRVAETAAAARVPLAEVLAQPAVASAHTVDAVGHAHIDSAWLWPVRETIRKCARTFSNVLDLMEEDPEFVFACSSAQQYAWIEQHYPQLHERIAARITEGRWIVTGGMWVESDTMMPSGESLVRQFSEGAAYFRDAFGLDAAGAWLPDSFGYSAGMPQIAVAAGARWFLTQKLSWNDTNRMPHHTFWWRGIDGSRIFTHFPPSDTYSAHVTPAELDLAERQFTEHASSSRSLMLFGHGDGGGGPTRRMMAAARRSADLEGLPRVRVVSPDDFFVAAMDEQPDAPEWAGELYLELHRGTLTSQARTKAGNRRNERLLLAAELWCTTAAVRTGREYPLALLRDAWRTVLLLQFHDILPGSAIGWVHEQAEAAHAEVTATLEREIAAALAALVGDGDQELLANASAVEVNEVAAGAVSLATSRTIATGRDTPDGIVLEDDRARVVWDRTGAVRSFVDLASGREVVPAGDSWGTLRLHPDRPARWDAWDVERHYDESVENLGPPASIDVAEGIVTVSWQRGDSSFRQSWSLDDGCLQLRVVVDWEERGLLLKLGLPLDVRSAFFATETQFGHVMRPLAKNTSWDEARFEVCQHRWMHVGEPDFGIAIANDTTYGLAVRSDARAGVDVGISLLRGTEFPDPASDRGHHEFRFAMRAGASIGDAVRLGRSLDAALTPVRGGGAVEPLVTLESATLIRESVTLAHDGSGDVIVRVSESRGGRGRGILSTSFSWTDAALVDLHESPLPSDAAALEGVQITVEPEHRRVTIDDRAFGLLTLRLRR
ncbi:alpha-mannosidase [Microbacterium sp. SLBN-146]|uniref:alpha-mannosidase n=1 Tax=Microbacterium sp. SLBN-146 TaxID=2768457 RepID=UPI00115254DB|nr:alpha-mannosidase [Microbacterium sp. SLBN-146]TQJ31215.1 alpha-mannosidase [Microbacterium sp. SLBN-146]